MLGLVTKTLRSGLGLILSFWIAGAGCMFGCQNMLASAATGGDPQAVAPDLATIVSGDACASSGSHDCCAKKKAEAIKVKAPVASAARPSLQTAALISQKESLSADPSGSMKDCPLAMTRAVAVTKTSGSKQAAPVALSLKALPVEPSHERQTSLAPKARLPNRGHTYLSCCVFLI